MGSRSPDSSRVVGNRSLVSSSKNREKVVSKAGKRADKADNRIDKR